MLTSSSYRITSAIARHFFPLIVINSGSPGPAPTRNTFPALLMFFIAPFIYASESFRTDEARHWTSVKTARVSYGSAFQFAVYRPTAAPKSTTDATGLVSAITGARLYVR